MNINHHDYKTASSVLTDMIRYSFKEQHETDTSSLKEKQGIINNYRLTPIVSQSC